MKRRLVKKVFFTMFILCIAVIGSVVCKNKNTGVFINVNRNLPIYCVDTKDKKVALTFDVSWGTDNTDKILQVLDKYNIKASFFLVGGWVDQYPDKVKSIYEKGHEIGNHSNKHPDMTKISRDKIIQDIDINDSKIRSLTGEGTKLFRCPEGSYNNLVIQTVKDTNHYCIQWDVDSIDWREEGANLEYDRVVKKVKNGSIILFHNNAKYTPDNLPRVIEKLKKDGYEFVKVGDLIYKENYHIDYDGKQISN
ncbi:polysaccharide deacetylase family sporulation protein PdaB [Clostridium sp. P21]|uniref:Polysaccharide deacetylase family sporulation protein PdaB n=1 Tax=Clostridium muellerianum TaxID=2716538 RepID=A0A7Y0EHG7_9CLOT|nr:polysaccharide deacetylase family sporulation protein PdaB [Clostridium muellerianum]NMM63177.1 polysaccharide deacetylase family sporulation protein PdaB [Clostridium muellerianum]